jgi:hypothetical protein
MPTQTIPWYRTAAATAAAGLLGLALIATLVVAVVTMSSKWSTPETETILPPGTHLPEPPHVVAKSSASTTTSYPNVRLSTTDIGAPGVSTPGMILPGGQAPSQVSPSDQLAPTFPRTFFPTRATNPPGSHTIITPRLNPPPPASP